eukprot:TRINITY_DN111887_c0_g1_i1.p1 TRINITY_DN111887_c0_g1~~TRINITY_DN111887_c0_g1_i1.p1  ORF type:complete len:259 (+),score=99.59 TRINITY_DN111887_c0_g1_i1:59-835(+)
MAEEEQALEIEALQSLYEEGKEFELISNTEFKLKLVPDMTGEQENHVGVTLHVTYVPEYPEVAPEWELEDVKLSDEKEKQLKEQIEETINSSLGMAMIYSVAEVIKDFLQANNQKQLSMHEEMMLRTKGEEEPEGDEDEEGDEEEEEEEEEWKGLAEKALCAPSERITPESFAEWKANFDDEMIKAGVLKKDDVTRKSGRQIFQEAQAEEAGKATSTGGYPGSPSAEKNKSDAPIVYNAALFGEDMDDDLDDLDDGDD